MPTTNSNWSVKDFALRAWSLESRGESICIWETSNHFQVKRDPEAFESLQTCDTFEEAMKTAKYYLQRAILGYID